MSISNQDDYLDGSELKAEIERLNEELEEKRDELRDAHTSGNKTLYAEIDNEMDDIANELQPLAELEEDVFFDLGDTSLIKESAFEEHMQRFAIDCGDISEDSSVFAYIDWDTYARHMQIDYTSVDFDGEEYLYRS